MKFRNTSAMFVFYSKAGTVGRLFHHSNWSYALVMCLICSFTARCDGKDASAYTVTTQSGYAIELTAVGDGSGAWWSPSGPALESVPVSVDLGGVERGSREPALVRDFLFTVREPAKRATKTSSDSELLPFVSISGVPTVSTLDTEPSQGDGVHYVVLRTGVSRATQDLRVTIDAPNSPWLVEASITATPDGVQPSEPVVGTLDDSAGAVTYRMSIHSTLPEDMTLEDSLGFLPLQPQRKGVNAPAFPLQFTNTSEQAIDGLTIVSRHGESLTANSIAYVVLDPPADTALADQYELRGMSEEIPLYQPSGFRRKMLWGHVSRNWALPKDSTDVDAETADNSWRLLVQEFGATGVIEGGGFNAPAVYGLRQPVTFELRRRPYESLTIDEFAMTPETQQ